MYPNVTPIQIIVFFFPVTCVVLSQFPPRNAAEEKSFARLEQGMEKHEAMKILSLHRGKWETQPEKRIRELWKSDYNMFWIGLSEDRLLTYKSWRYTSYYERLCFLLSRLEGWIKLQKSE